MDVKAEIRELKRRVGELEGGFGCVTQQVQGVHRDLLAFQEQTNQRFDKVERDVQGVKADVRGLKGDVAALKAEVAGLRKDLPSVVGDVMREVLREQKG